MKFSTPRYASGRRSNVTRTHSQEYTIWRSMKARCLNRNHSGFAYYGGRGISICDRWLRGDGDRSGFQCFLADVGPRPSRNHSIDRIDNDGNYEPSNVRWATRSQQMCNRRICTTQPRTVRYIGVTLRSDCNRWRAKVGTGKKYTNIGQFATAIEAALAYDDFVACNHLNKQLNFPERNRR
jgi:hypothetical protein